MDHILVQRYDAVVELILNRPKALNANNTAMNKVLYDTLQQYRNDRTVQQILITSSNDKAFCAGGDVRALREFMIQGSAPDIAEFFCTEYCLDLLLHSYPKPIISIVNGIAFGGGMGIAVHPQHTVITENAVFAMPETAIGFYPDAGSSYFLPMLPYPLARYMALTGAKLSGIAAYHYGLAQHYIPAEHLDSVLAQLRTGETIIDTAAQYNDSVSAIDLNYPQIEKLFSLPLDELVTEVDHTEFAHSFDNCSPTSVLIADELLSIALHSKENLQQRLNREYHLSIQVVQQPDFIEGVRAVLVDKDYTPNFQSAPRPVEITEIFLSAQNGPDIITL